MKKDEKKLAGKKITDFITDERLRNPAFGFITAVMPVMAAVFAVIAIREGRYRYLAPLAMLFVMFLILFLGTVRSRSRAKKIVKGLERSGSLETAAAELDAENSEKLAGGLAVAAEHFLFGSRSISVLRYEDIVKVYPVVYKAKNGTTGYLAVDTAEKTGINAMMFGEGDAEAVARQAIEIIQKHNPSVTVGETVRR